jgi:perosamine synthetase
VVLADVDPETWTLSPDSVARILNHRTKAIVPVHLYGVPADMDSLVDIAQRAGVPLVEDATEALDGSWRGRSAGTIGDFGAFSFNGNKAITTGGGGMLVGRDPSRVEHARFIANQARDERRGYFHTEIGCNYRMTNIEAALGLAQLEQLDSFQASRRGHAALFRQELHGLPGLVFQKTPPNAIGSDWMTSVLLPPGRDPEEVRQFLASHGIQTRRLFHPLSDMPPWSSNAPFETPVAHSLHARGLCLPSSPRNGIDAILRACEEIRRALA